MREVVAPDALRHEVAARVIACELQVLLGHILRRCEREGESGADRERRARAKEGPRVDLETDVTVITAGLRATAHLRVGQGEHTDAELHRAIRTGEIAIAWRPGVG